VQQNLEAEVTALRDQKEKVNQKRKLAQIEFQNEARQNKIEYETYIKDNEALESTLGDLRFDVERLKRIAKKRRVLPDGWTDITLDPVGENVVIREDDEEAK
jgi:hypothetical protein